MADFRLCFIDRPSVGTPEDCITLANGTGVEEVRLEPVEVKSEEDFARFQRKYMQFRNPPKCENSIKILDGTNITLVSGLTKLTFLTYCVAKGTSNQSKYIFPVCFSFQFTLKLANFEPQAAFGFRVMNFTSEFHVSIFIWSQR